ncbi:Peptidyl-prolyl cis-trans isomerase FKBP16-4, chloroplastic [Sesbania bispinosa]|nr:Peptidyl-prolyl cis-trans isomerase FKBP16-4, chloroplastic [Sesbania bispinosa]
MYTSGTIGEPKGYHVAPHIYSSSDKTAAEQPSTVSLQIEGRRALLNYLLTTVARVYTCDVAGAVSTSRRALRGAKISESDYTTLPNGLK